jgi:riboflavin kinase/FMN adenylyltransferase
MQIHRHSWSSLKRWSGLQQKVGQAAIGTLGNFDGVHRGHQRLVEEVVEQAASSDRKIVITFYPHPAQVVKGGQKIATLTTLRQKVRILDALGVSDLVLLHFNQNLLGVEAYDFMEAVLIRALNLKSIVIGPDAAVGKGRAGTPDRLREFMNRRGRECVVVPFLEGQGDKISSRRIREALGAGDLSTARVLLGRSWSIEGVVRHGEKRGRSIGFPTANLAPGSSVLPPQGVYATRTWHRGRQYSSVTNVGVRPTVSDLQNVTIETHILDLPDGEFYGERIEVFFEFLIRSEMKFPGLAELMRQIEADVIAARKLL